MARTDDKRRFGDRKEGRWLRSLNPFYTIIPYIMIERSDAMNYFQDRVDMGVPDRWMRQKRAKGFKGLGFLHLFVAAYVRTIAEMPGINRFINGRRIYARNNIEINMAVKRSFALDAPETTIKVVLDRTDTIFDVYRKFTAKTEEIKANIGDNNTEQAAAAFTKLPRFLLRFGMWCVRVLDYFGLLPQRLLDASPFHGSMIISDLGSLGIPPIYHHLYNLGNLPVFITFGAKYKVNEINRNGELEEHKYVDFTAVTDERVCDGFYYATAFKRIKFYLKNPQLLELPPERVEQDVF